MQVMEKAADGYIAALVVEIVAYHPLALKENQLPLFVDALGQGLMLAGAWGVS